MFKCINWKTGWPRQLDSRFNSSAVCIGLGTNIGTPGQRTRILRLALHKINALSATRILAVSSLYETPPWGVLDQPPFFNVVAAIHTALRPIDLLHALKSIEVHLGRKSRARWGPREIDLDIIIAGHLNLKNPRLTIPHPQLPHRHFVLIPLKEIQGPIHFRPRS